MDSQAESVGSGSTVNNVFQLKDLPIESQVEDDSNHDSSESESGKSMNESSDGESNRNKRQRRKKKKNTMGDSITRFEDNSIIGVHMKRYVDAKALFEQTHYRIKNPEGVARFDPTNVDSFMFYPDSQIRAATTNWTIGVKRKSFIAMWLKDNTAQCRKTYGFYPPPMTTPPDTLNIWCGFKYDKGAFASISMEDIFGGYVDYAPNLDIDDIMTNPAPNLWDMVKVIVWNLASQYAPHYWAILQCIGHIILCPGELNQRVITMQGPEGVGKTFIWLDLCTRLFGERHVISSSNPSESVLGRFNSAIMGTLLLVLSEVGENDVKSLGHRLKELATDKRISVEKKGRDAFVIDNNIRVVIATNSEELNILNLGSRRDQTIKANDYLAGNVTWWTLANDLLDNPMELKCVYEALKAVPFASKFSRLRVTANPNFRHDVSTTWTPLVPLFTMLFMPLNEYFSDIEIANDLNIQYGTEGVSRGVSIHCTYRCDATTLYLMYERYIKVRQPGDMILTQRKIEGLLQSFLGQCKVKGESFQGLAKIQKNAKLKMKHGDQVRHKHVTYFYEFHRGLFVHSLHVAKSEGKLVEFMGILETLQHSNNEEEEDEEEKQMEPNESTVVMGNKPKINELEKMFNGLNAEIARMEEELAEAQRIHEQRQMSELSRRVHTIYMQS